MKLAIVGAGMIVKDFLSMVQEIPSIQLEAIVGMPQDLETMNDLKSKYQISKVYTDLIECLKTADVDTVYVAVPNHLHFTIAKQALLNDKHVICEKPFTLSLAELNELEELALEKKLILIEAITNQYLTNYKQIKETISDLGELKVIECNYSQYSSRYDAFKKGDVLPAFNPKFGGGALLDINIYNIHFIVGLLGLPDKVIYSANVSRNVDTSGVLLLSYKDTKVICIGAKDSTAPIRTIIQGDEGSIVVNGPTNVVDNFDVLINKQEPQKIDKKINSHRMHEEFILFEKVIDQKDFEFSKKMLEHSKKVMTVVDMALASADIKLG